jgi:ATP-dependent Clp protease ATP-binding subunit ClpA
MRVDKFTTKLQEALADAQSLAVGNDNQYIDPVHLLAALLNQERVQVLVCCLKVCHKLLLHYRLDSKLLLIS